MYCTVQCSTVPWWGGHANGASRPASHRLGRMGNGKGWDGRGVCLAEISHRLRTFACSVSPWLAHCARHAGTLGPGVAASSSRPARLRFVHHRLVPKQGLLLAHSRQRSGVVLPFWPLLSCTPKPMPSPCRYVATALEGYFCPSHPLLGSPLARAEVASDVCL